MRFLENILRVGKDEIEFLIKASHYAGILESEKIIEVESWDGLISVLLEYVDWYLADCESEDFFEALREKLTEVFPP